jgi:hypothetical protein
VKWLLAAAAIALVFASGWKLGRANPKLNNGDYQTDNGPIVRIPGIPAEFEVSAITAPTMTIEGDVPAAIRCVEFSAPSR